MRPNLLVLGGTTEATALAQRLADQGIGAVFSYAGRVARPKRQPLPTRVGGFGGVAGLVDYINVKNVTHVIDATHPFASGMSWNAARACAETGTPLLALTRPAWARQDGDIWRVVADMDGAVAALAGPSRRVMLAIGRMHLEAFSSQPQHHYLLRLIDAPETPVPLPDTEIVIAQGPFTYADDLALMQRHGIEVVVSKNAGGSAARAKIDAARDLGLQVIMIDRPALPKRRETGDIDAVLRWIVHPGTDLGV